ncbi:aminoglycoside phosphotransferase family protein, partial [Streptomyces sp. NPDC001876]
FLDAYRAAGGPAVRAEGDPWPDLDVAARALTVQAAALAFAKSAAEGRSPDEVEQLMIDACVRIASLPPELTPEPSS